MSVNRKEAERIAFRITVGVFETAVIHAMSCEQEGVMLCEHNLKPLMQTAITYALEAKDAEIERLKSYFCNGHQPSKENQYIRCGWCARQDESARLKEAVGLLRKLFITMDHAKIFIRTREKMHSTGIDIYCGEVEETDAFLAKQDKQGVE